MKKTIFVAVLLLLLASLVFAQVMKRGGGEVSINQNGKITIASRSDQSVNITGPTNITGATAITGAETISSTLGVTGASTLAGQVTVTRDPASTTNTAGSLVVNPATSATNELYLALLDNGSTVFSVDKEGDTVILGGITLNTNKFTVASASGNTAIAGTLAVTGAMNGPFGASRITGSTQLLTAAMSGQLLVVNNASDAATVFTLPAASTAGLRFCFSADAVTGSNREVDVEPPAGSDLIIGTTTAAGGTGIATTAGAGHGIKNTHATAVRGNAVCLQSDGVNTWYMTSISGTWAAY